MYLFFLSNFVLVFDMALEEECSGFIISVVLLHYLQLLIISWVLVSIFLVLVISGFIFCFMCLQSHLSYHIFILSTFMSEIGAWRQPLAWHVQINVFSAGGITQIQ